MKRILLSLLMLICIDVGCQAQTSFGVTIGLQPALRNQIEQTVSQQVYDFPVYFMQHFTAGIFLRKDITKYFYMQLDVNASLDAQWGYVCAGENFLEEFERAFENPNKIRVDVPIYLGAYLLKKDAFKVRVFAAPQYKIRMNTNLQYSPVALNNFNLNTGVGIDFLKFLTFNINYRIPFNYGKTALDKTRLSATLGIIF